jgi:WD40 repeat protein
MKIKTLTSILFLSVLFSSAFADVITEPIRTFSGHTGEVWSVAFSPDGMYALSGSDDHTLKLWDVNSGTEIRSFSGHTGRVNSVAFSPDGRYALSGSNDIKLWDVSSGAEIRSFSRQCFLCFKIESVAFSPDGLYALSSYG